MANVSVPGLSLSLPGPSDSVPLVRSSSGLVDRRAQVSDIAAAMGVAPTYLGQVATRCYLSNNSAAIANCYSNSRSTHWARDKIVNPTVMFPNWRTNGVAEQSNPVGTIKASIEYPAGVFTQANEVIANGNAAVAFPANTTFPLTFNVTIPNGQKFYVRVLLTNATTLLWSQAQTVYNMLSTDAFENGTGVPVDKTIGGTYAAPGNFGYYPMAILAQTSKPSIMIVGDSRAVGGQEYMADPSGDAGEVARIMGPAYGYINIGISGTLGSGYLSATRTLRDALFQYCSHVFDSYGVNDIGGGGNTGAQVVTTRAAIAALYPNNKVLGTTLAPYVPSTDGFATIANQTFGTNQQNIREFNRLCRLGIVGELFCMDVADMIDPTRRNLWPVSYNPNDAARPNAWTGTGSVSTAGVLTLTAITGAVAIGDTIWGANVNPGYLAGGVFVTAQISGTTGSTGTYQLNINPAAAIASGTISTGSWATQDGLHMSGALAERVRDLGRLNIPLITR